MTVIWGVVQLSLPRIPHPPLLVLDIDKGIRHRAVLRFFYIAMDGARACWDVRRCKISAVRVGRQFMRKGVKVAVLKHFEDIDWWRPPPRGVRQRPTKSEQGD